ncbi:tol-pal system-associated acyl-CoA thioesterase [Paracoccus aminophilus]|uniref:4-hydroxybenzoyl-CoA thioesterase n=1 Tax=Paracoccus aminophilus JCM 7686 TaxID=1367847 RepID=S5XW32_PARAH|nr:tol-pal system-associated acyl-CoA thioesterase [Paracoccus aminophilus]AGT07580.1 4-hydroxybenzoyl-CoA thioesterase [Paracoccus aminophilus JCM 7686]
MHRFQVRVYYEDTDLAGIVYYANYLKFIERARSEWIRDLGIDQAGLRDSLGIVFAVRHLEADYLAPARYDDLLVVESALHALTPARLVLDQRVSCGERVLFAARVTLVCLNELGRPARLPQALVAAMQAN